MKWRNLRATAAAAALVLASAAQAQPPAGAGKSASHAAVCPGPAAEGFARCHAHVVTDANGNPNATTTPSGYGPIDLRTAYSVPYDGSNPSTQSTLIAIVDAYDYPKAESDLAVYRKAYGLPPCTTANGCFQRVNQNGVAGSYPQVNVGWNQEAALDLDMASAMCPNCKILLVEANSATLANLATAVNTAATLGAHVISNSYGGGESGSAAYEPSYNHPGIAITVSSGDSGYGVQFPASSNHVTAVGGTSLKLDSTKHRLSETAWSGAGSGCSTLYAKPGWQADTSCARRTVADVSAVADPNTGVAVYGPTSRTRSAWLVFGGTSVAAPVIGGIYAVNGGAVNYGGDPYSAAAGALFDVTSGSNGSCSGSYLCTAKPGFDGPTGLGTPNGASAF
jgi:subtilase family serine protease